MANNAPVLTGAPPAATFDEDNTTAAFLVGGFLSSTDADPGALRGIAITGLGVGNGHWEYSTNGTTWSTLAAASDSSAFLLLDTDYVRFVPDQKNGTIATITYRAWDQTSGAAHSTADTSGVNNGGATAFSSNTISGTVTVTSVNDAPVLAVTGPSLTGITEDDASNSGQTVSSFAGAGITDVDTGAAKGIAVTDYTNGNGHWEYSFNGGSTWQALGLTLTQSAAMLMDANDLVRFVPDGKNGTTATITYRAWDHTDGHADGDIVDTTTAGGTTAYSLASDTASIAVSSVNDAPTLTGAHTPLTTITEDQTTNGGQTVASFLGSADVDTGALTGIALSGTTNGNGHWEYSLDGGSHWNSVGTVSEGTALLLKSDDYVRFVPDAKNGTTGSLTYHAWDQTTGTHGNTVNLTTGGATGGTTAYSTATDSSSITVTDVNDIATVTVTPVVTTESDLASPQSFHTASQVTITDVDIDDSANPTNYVANSGSVTGVTGPTPPSGTLADLLSIDPLDGTVHYDRAAFNWLSASQQVTYTITFQAKSGDDTPQTETLTVTINGANDAPVMTSSLHLALATITEDVTASPAHLVSEFRSPTTDADSGAHTGIAVTGTAGNGHWEYSLNGSTWSTLTGSDSSALLLRDTDMVRYVPDAKNGETASLTYHAWDQSDGNAAGNAVNASTTGGTTAFSTASDTITLQATSVNDAPIVVAQHTPLTTITEDQTTNGGQTVASFLGTAITDVDTGALSGIALSGASNGNGHWEYSLNAGTNWTSVGTVSDSAAILLRSDDFVRFVPDAMNGTTASLTYHAWDQTTGSHGNIVNLTTGGATGGTTAYSTATDTSSITVTDVNDAPVVSASTVLAPIAEDSGPHLITQADLLSHAADVDTGATLTATNLTLIGAGSLVDNHNGTWTFTPGQDDDSAVSFSYGVTDGIATVATSASLDITPVNDPAIVNGAKTGSVTEAGVAPGTPVATGLLTDTDVDNAPNLFSAVLTATSSDHGYGKYTMTSGGTWTFALDNTNATIQALNSGDTTSDTFTVQTIDGTTQQIIVTINGANDAATISGTFSGSATEAGGIANGTAGSPATGTLTDTDIDNPANTFAAITTPTASDSNYGKFTLTTGGVWTFTVNDSNSAVQLLNTGNTLTDTFTAHSIDGTAQQITVTINGANDAAVISGTTAGDVIEAGGVANAIPGTPTATGTLTDTDVDNAANSFASVIAPLGSDHGYGKYTMTSGGVWSYTLDNTNATVQALKPTDTLTDTFSVQTADGTSQQVTVTIHGANDAATIGGTATGNATEAGGVANGTAGSPATGTLTDTDVDNPANTFTAVTTPTLSDSHYGSFTMTAGGTWTFTVDDSNSLVQLLNVGNSITDTFTVQSVDGTPKQVTVTIHGANDTAVISGTIAGSVTEASGVANAVPGTPTASGTLTDTDVDNAANTFIPTSAATDSDHGYGTFAVTTGGLWTYTLDNNDPAVQALKPGQTLTDTFTVLTVDSTPQQITITINGANDAAVVSGTATGSVTEAGGVANAIAGTPTATGTLTDTDVDNPANTFTAVTTATAGDHGYGTFTMTAGGAWSYALDNTNNNVQALNSGGTLTDTFTVSTIDGTTQQISVTINGTNDAAAIGGTIAGSVIEAGGVSNAISGTPTASGTLTDTDVDNVPNTFANFAPGSATNSGYGTFGMTSGGAWTYTLNNNNPAVQALNSGGTLTDTFTVQSIDGTAQTITVTINGTNDAAVIGGVSTGNATEAGGVGNATAGSPATGTLTDTDVDNTPNSFTAVTTPTASDHGYGSFTITAGGAWTFVVNDTNNNVQALNSGGTLTETFTVSSIDGTPQVVTVTINGTNDAASIAGTIAGSVIEAGGVANANAGTPTASGTLTDTDVDNTPNTFAIVLPGANTAHGYGTFGMTAGGTWTYTLNNDNAAVQALNAGGTLTDTFTVQSIDGTAQTITVTINGTNDAAVIGGVSTGDATEAGGIANGTAGSPATGTLTDTDVDNPPNTFTAVTTPTLGDQHYGSFTMTAGGAWTYVVDDTNSVVQALNGGGVLTDTFTVTTVDGTQKQVSVTIHGTNDAAVIGGTHYGEVTEAGGYFNGTVNTPTASGTLTDTDVDNTPNAFLALSGGQLTDHGYGTFGMTAGGTWTYTLNNDLAAVQALQDGQTLSDSFTVQTIDGTPKVVHITICGSNDAAVISGTTTGDATEAGGVFNGTSGTGTSGFLTDTDVDNVANTFIAVSAPTATDHGYGTFTMTSGGTWSFAVNDSNTTVEALNATQTLNETFTVNSVDGTPQVITVTIHGVNDAAVISGPITGTVIEAGGVANGILNTALVSNTLTDTDVDNPPNTFIAVSTPANSDYGYGDFSMTDGGVWTYRLHNSNPAVEALNVGNTLTDTFTVQTIDGTSQLVTITINGSNDAAIISGPITGDANEGGTGLLNGGPATTATGRLTDTDIDNPANTFTAVATATATDHGYGTFKMTAGGRWTFTVNDANATVDALKPGQTLNETFTVTSVDGTPQVITVTIHGSNDAAVISGVTTGSVTEIGTGVVNGSAGVLTASTTLTDTDVDNPANTFTVVSAGAATDHGYGTFKMTGGGKWTYTLDNTNADVQHLNVGDTLTDTFTITTIDGTPQVITVTINGANDAAVVGGATSGTATEAGTGVVNGGPGAPATGTLTDTDVDNPANTFTASSGTTTHGSYAITASGAWTFTVNDANTAVQHLNVGDTFTDTFTVTTVDGTPQLVTVTINGANDAAVISGTVAGSVTEIGTGVVNGSAGVPTASGTLTDTDIDNATNSFTAVATATASDHGFGTFKMTAGGAWTYTLDDTNASVQALNVGNTLTDTFTVKTIDGTPQVVTVTINGSNDAAVVGGVASGSAVEAGGVANAIPGAPATGTLTDTDVDNPANTFTPATGTTTHGSFAITAGGAWTFTVDDTNPAVQALNVGGVLTDAFTVTTVDGTPQVVTVTINGANDAAVISGTTTGNVTEAGGVANTILGTPTVTGTLTDTDVDNPANTFAAVTTATASDQSFGTFTMTAAGVWSYTLDNNNASVQALNAGGTLMDSFTVTTADGTSQLIAVKIHGANDAAVISPLSAVGTATEAGGVANAIAGSVATGTLTDTDIDNSPNAFTAVTTATASDHGFGTFTMTTGGVWTFTVNDDNSTIQALNVGSSVTETFTVKTIDGTQKVVLVTINGANDAAVISGTTAGDVIEASGVSNNIPGTPTATGTLTDTDIDNPSNLFLANAGSTAHGSFSITTGGVWTYTLDNNNAAVQALNVGNTLTDTFTVRSTDSTAQQITVTIHGANDLSVVGGAISGSATEAGGVANGTAGTPATGTLTDTDVDNAANAFNAVTGGSTTNGFGTFAITAGGTWTYTVNDALPAIQALTIGGATLSDSFTVQTADGTSQVVTVTINGSNDAAVISGTAAGDVTEKGGVANSVPGLATANGTLTDTDVDNPANQFIASSGSTAHGTFTVTAGGAWTYTVDDTNAAVQALNAGSTLTDTFTVSTIDSTPKVVAVTIHGVNDTAIIGGTASGSATEASGAANATLGSPAIGTLTDTDVDNPANTFTAVTTPTASDLGFGTFTITAGGTWTFNVNDSNPTVQTLNVGGTLTDTFAVKTADGTSQLITVTIIGANDAAVFTGATTGDVTEAGGLSNKTAGTPTATGALTNTDIDNPSNVFLPVAAGTKSNGGFGTFGVGADGTWAYNLDNTNLAVEALKDNQTITDTFNVRAGDSTLQLVTVTIHGADDFPTTSSSQVTSANQITPEQVAVQIDPALTIVDADNATLPSATVAITGNFQPGEDVLAFNNNDANQFGNIAGSYQNGALALSSSGSTATLAQWEAALHAVTYTDTSDTPNTASRSITFTVNDGTVSNVLATDTVGVVAVNDAPVNGVPASLSAGSNQSITISGLSIADPDAGSATLSTSLSVTHGTLAIGSSGGATVGGSGTSAVTLTGTLAQLNAALGNVQYAPTQNFFGSDTLTMSSSDGGNAGTGGVKTDLDTIAIAVGSTVTGTSGDDNITVSSSSQRIDAGAGTDTVNFNFKLVDATVSYLGNATVIDTATSHTVLTGVEIYKFTDGTVTEKDNDPLVDDLFYYANNHDVWNAHIDADTHYHTVGWKEGRDPDAYFSTSTYLSMNPAVKAAGVDPLVQFDQTGWKTGADPSIYFDTNAYLAANPDVKAAGVDPLAHFLADGQQEGRAAIAPQTLVAANGFDYVYYLQHNPDVAAAHVDPLQHFETTGWKEGRNPNAYFDVKAYLSAYPDVAAAGVNPLDQYHNSGFKEGRDPSVNFDTASYLAANPDVKAAGVDPLQQFLAHGIYEGRHAFADGHFG